MQFSDEHINSPYGEYRIVTHYLWCEGILEAPVASGNLQNSEMVRISQPMGGKLVFWTAERSAYAPTLPSPIEKPGETLNYSRILVNAPKIASGGDEYLYSASGIYAFFLAQPIAFDSGELFYPQEAVDTTTPQTMSPSQFGLPSGASAGLFSDDHVQEPYTEYGITTEYVWMNGVVQQPTTTPGASCEIIQTQSPYGWRKVNFTASRISAPPVLPAPTPFSGEYLNYYVLRLKSPKLMADGYTYIYSVDGEYWFWSQKPVDETTDFFPMGVVGYDGTSPQPLNPSNFNDNLIRV